MECIGAKEKARREKDGRKRDLENNVLMRVINGWELDGIAEGENQGHENLRIIILYRIQHS